MRTLLWAVRLLIALALIVDLRLYRYGLAGDILVGTRDGLEYRTLPYVQEVALIVGLVVAHGPIN